MRQSKLRLTAAALIYRFLAGLTFVGPITVQSQTQGAFINARKGRDGLDIVWSGGFLEGAESVDGPYSPIVPAFVGPNAVRGIAIPYDRPNRFFRVFFECLEAEFDTAGFDYFKSGDLGSYTDTWYSRSLAAMGEPSLYRPDTTPPDESYRFFELPSFGTYTVYRYERRGDALALKRVTLGPEGTDFDDCIVSQSTEELDPEVWESLREQITSSQILDLPTAEDVLLYDGVQMVFEARIGDRYHVVNRATPSYNTEERGLAAYLALFHEFSEGNR